VAGGLAVALLISAGVIGGGAGPAYGFQGFCDVVAPARAKYGRIEICAGNARPSSAKFAYDPGMAADGDNKTAWLENAPGPDKGAWIEYVFAAPHTVQTIRLVNGYARSGTVFRANGRVHHARILADGVVVKKLTLNDSRKPQTFRLAQPVKARFLRLEIVDTFPGRKSDYAAITEFLVDLAEHAQSKAQ